MNTFTSLRIENDGAVRSIVLARPEQFNTITVALRDELGQAVDAADRDPAVKVILLRAEGRAFCAGFGLDWSTFDQAEAGQSAGPVWDSVADLSLIGSFAAVFSKLHSCSKPTIAAVQGWCVAGGTDLAFNSDLIICAYDPQTSRLLGCLFDGVARHTQEGIDFVARAKAVGWRNAVRERDAPFGDYGERMRGADQ